MSVRKPSPHRQHTDESLRAERGAADEALRRAWERQREEADAAVNLARSRADAVLERARARADMRLERKAAGAADRASVRQERGQEDAALARERAETDQALERERARSDQFARERAETDSGLALERSDADQGLRVREEFLGEVSHDLRTLLSGVALTVEMIESEAGEHAGRTGLLRHTDRLRSYVASMRRLVGDLVDAACVESGKLRLAPAAHEVRGLAQDALDAFLPLATERGVTLTPLPEAPPLHARCDDDRLLQVLANLLVNALDFTREGGAIRLTVEPAGSEVRFAVQDTGVGMTPEQLVHLFERTWQAPHSTRQGLGLGLYISHGIVEAHGGRIWAESTPGVGTTFFFTLPAAGAP